MNGLYLVKDGERIVSLAAEDDGKLYAFVPNVHSFVYNKPMSVDFQIDREMTYEPVNTETAASIVREGSIGKIDAATNSFLLEHMRAETRRLSPSEILDLRLSSASESTPAQVAKAVADHLRRLPLGQWITYKVYPQDLWRQARRRAVDLSTGRVRAFSNIPLLSRVTSNTDDDQIVEVSRTGPDTAAKTATRKKVVKKAAANKNALRGKAKAVTHVRVKSR